MLIIYLYLYLSIYIYLYLYLYCHLSWQPSISAKAAPHHPLVRPCPFLLLLVTLPTWNSFISLCWWKSREPSKANSSSSFFTKPSPNTVILLDLVLLWDCHHFLGSAFPSPDNKNMLNSLLKGSSSREKYQGHGSEQRYVRLPGLSDLSKTWLDVLTAKEKHVCLLEGWSVVKA